MRVSGRLIGRPCVCRVVWLAGRVSGRLIGRACVYRVVWLAGRVCIGSSDWPGACYRRWPYAGGQQPAAVGHQVGRLLQQVRLRLPAGRQERRRALQRLHAHAARPLRQVGPTPLPPHDQRRPPVAVSITTWIDLVWIFSAQFIHLLGLLSSLNRS